MTLKSLCQTLDLPLADAQGWDLPTLKAKAGEARRALAKRHHPDRGGDLKRMAAINALVDTVEAWTTLPWASRADLFADLYPTQTAGQQNVTLHHMNLGELFSYQFAERFAAFIRADQARRSRAQRSRPPLPQDSPAVPGSPHPSP